MRTSGTGETRDKEVGGESGKADRKAAGTLITTPHKRSEQKSISSHIPVRQSKTRRTPEAEDQAMLLHTDSYVFNTWGKLQFLAR